MTTSPNRTHESDAPSSWYELLGYDAGKLIQVALADFPLKRAEDPKSVELLHRRARKRLLFAEAELLTTDRTGFDGAVALPRSLEAVR